MSRKTAALKPQLNRIRAWSQEGSTDAWIAHQLDSTAEIIAEFRTEQGIGKSGPAAVLPITPDAIVEAMLAEEEAGTAPPKRRRTPAAVEDPPAEPAAADGDEPPPAAAKRRRRTKADAAAAAAVPETDDATPDPPADPVAAPDEAQPAAPARRRRRSAAERAAETTPAAEAPDPPSSSPDDERLDLAAEHEPPAADDAEGAPEVATRRRRRRGGRGRGAGNGSGSGRGDLRAQAVPGRVIVLGDAITSNATFREHWSDTSSFTVEVSAEAITLRRP